MLFLLLLPRLIWDESREQRHKLNSKCLDSGFCERRTFRGADRRRNPDQRTVGAIHPHRVSNQKDLGHVFTGDAAAVRLIPVDDELSIFPVGNDVFANAVRFTLRSFKST